VDTFAEFGTLIYSLDRLYKTVRNSTSESGEWSRSDLLIFHVSYQMNYYLDILLQTFLFYVLFLMLREINL
jgi:hypothetical protein